MVRNGYPDTLVVQIVADLPPTVAALIKQRITSDDLRDLTREAALNTARRHNPDDTLSEDVLSELRRLVLLRLSEDNRQDASG